MNSIFSKFGIVTVLLGLFFGGCTQDEKGSKPIKIVMNADGTASIEGNIERDPLSADSIRGEMPIYENGEIVDTAYYSIKVEGYKPIDNKFEFLMEGDCYPTFEELQSRITAMSEKYSWADLEVDQVSEDSAKVYGYVAAGGDPTYEEIWPLSKTGECKEKEIE